MAETAEQKKDQQRTRTTTTYVILEQQATSADPEVKGPIYVPVGTFEGIGADAAINQAAKVLQSEGREEFTLVAVPARSFQPQTFKLEVPAPRLVRA